MGDDSQRALRGIFRCTSATGVGRRQTIKLAASMTPKNLLAAIILAAVVTISAADAEVRSTTVSSEEGHKFVQSLQDKLDTLDEQLWSAGTDDADLILVQAEQSPRPSSQHDDLHLIEEDALRKAGFAPRPTGDGHDESSTSEQQLEELPDESSTSEQLVEQLKADQDKLLQMKMREKQANMNAAHEKAVRKVLQEGVGARMREQERFYSYMSRWWRLHRLWMKRHNAVLYEKLKEHRALSLSSLWKPFLLRWHYVQPRESQGYRYTWNNDGTYDVKRFLMKSKQKEGKHVASARIRSINNICFPGLLPPDQKNKLCLYERRVSARAAQFTLRRGKFEPPSLTVMRAYASFVPKSDSHVSKHTDTDQWTKAKPAVTFVSVQGLHWDLLEVMEYCDTPRVASGVSVPQAFSETTSAPVREYSLKFMEWEEIQMGRELLDTGATVENIELKSTDGKLRFSCVIPVDHPQNIDGKKMTLTQQKCSFYVRQWDFALTCPAGKSGAIALKTRVTARDDNGSGDGKPTMTPDFKKQLAFNKNKVSMQFEKQAVLHVHDDVSKSDTRSSVPVIMTQSDKMQWTSDPRFKTSRNVFFSFIHADVSKLKEGILNWDPEMKANFQAPAVATTKKKLMKVDSQSLDLQDVHQGNSALAVDETLEVDASAFVQLQSSSATGTLSFPHVGVCIFVVYTMLHLIW